MPARSLDRSARWALVVATLGTLVAVRWWFADTAGGLVLDALVAVAAVAATLGAARRARPGRSRLAWHSDAVGLALWLLAPLAWLTGLPDAVATTGRIGFVVLTGAACWLTAKAPDVWSRVRLIVDGAIAGAALFVVAWTPLLRDVAESAGGGATGALAVALPLGAFMVLTLFGSVSVTEIPRCRRGMPRMYMTALGVVALSDVLWVEAGRGLWAVGFACVVVATRVYRGTSQRHVTLSTHPALALAPYAALAPAVVTLVVQHLGGGVPEEVTTVAVVTGALLIVRQQATLMENHNLVARLEATERRLRHQAMHDSLTSLGGRALLHERLDAAVHAYREAGTPVAVVFIDLDDFKQINDVHGHAAGDDVLVEISRRLARALAPLAEGALAFRMSGDEFAVLLSGEAAVGAADTARGLLGAIGAPIDVGGTSVEVTGSVGVAEPGPDVPAESSALLRAADVAMYGVKHSGKGGVAEAAG